MPTVLITGINGFVAIHTAVQFLENGWDVRGTVRSEEKGKKALAVPAFEKYQGKVAYVIVEDLIEGDFTEALEGVEAVAHCASPWHFNGKSWSEYRDPAVQGTTRILEQAAKVPSVKGAAIVSSFAAVGDFSTPFYKQDGRVYSEDDWLAWTDEDCEKADEKNGPQMWYCTSKKYAEIAAFDTQKRVGASYSLAAINPPAIFGPSIHYSSAEGLDKSDVSTSTLYACLATGKDSKVPETAFSAFADVRSVASAMYLTITKNKSGRFCIYDGNYDHELIAKTGRRQRPDLEKYIPFVAEDKSTPVEQGAYSINTSKADKELGLKHYTLEQTIGDTIAEFEKLGSYKA